MTVAGQERVSAVEKVRGEGVYTIVTNEVSVELYLTLFPRSKSHIFALHSSSH
jgi:hypothetical protein